MAEEASKDEVVKEDIYFLVWFSFFLITGHEMLHMKVVLKKLSLDIIKSLRTLVFKVRNTVMPIESMESTSFKVL